VRQAGPDLPRKTLVLTLLLVLSVFPLGLAAQAIRSRGTVLLNDSLPARDVRVVLHRVGQRVQGPLDSTLTDAQGRFRFTFQPDTTVLYLLSARYRGIEYFSSPLPTHPSRPDSVVRILVYDTSSTAPVRLEARHLVLSRPGENGDRSVLDFMVLRNDGHLTRTGPDSVRPSWSTSLPVGTRGLELGESDFSPDAVSRRGDSLVLTAPLAPGEKQLTIQYQVPSDRHDLRLAFPERTPTVNVLAEENAIAVSGGGLARADSQNIQGRTFHRWTGSMPAGSSLRISLPKIDRTSRWVLMALVGIIALGLTGAGWYALRPRARSGTSLSPGQLVDALAALDDRYAGKEAELSPAEWASYRAERARLKAELEASLAAASSAS
jgi:hypothetical protein